MTSKTRKPFRSIPCCADVGKTAREDITESIIQFHSIEVEKNDHCEMRKWKSQVLIFLWRELLHGKEKRKKWRYFDGRAIWANKQKISVSNVRHVMAYCITNHQLSGNAKASEMNRPGSMKEMRVSSLQ